MGPSIDLRGRADTLTVATPIDIRSGEVMRDVRQAVEIRGLGAVRTGDGGGDIGRAIERFARTQGLSVVQEYQGHGLGREFHQEPGVPHYVPKTGVAQVVIEPGMCFTVEPMLNIGTWRTMLDTRDKWTVRTMDLSLSAQFEHSILITEAGPEILTLTKNGPQCGHQF